MTEHEKRAREIVGQLTRDEFESRFPKEKLKDGIIYALAEAHSAGFEAGLKARLPSDTLLNLRSVKERHCEDKCCAKKDSHTMSCETLTETIKDLEGYKILPNKDEIEAEATQYGLNRNFQCLACGEDSQWVDARDHFIAGAKWLAANMRNEGV